MKNNKINNLINEPIIPFKGTSSFVLGSKLTEVRSFLKENKIAFNQTIDSNKGCLPEVPWTIININNSITLCFAMDILFEAMFEGNYKGCLPNNIGLGSTFSALKCADSSISYDEDNEDYSSDAGYWFELNSANDTVSSITVFLSDVCEDSFFTYEWVKKYE